MYIMSFVAAVPADAKDDYRAHSTKAAEVFKEYGATRVVECWGEDVPEGKVTSYPKAVAAQDGEIVVTGWQEWPDKATCDANMEKAMKDPRMQDMRMPFDGARLIYGGFESLLDL